jgi:hypothetical protein
MHQVDIAVEATINVTAAGDSLSTTLHPRVLLHHLATAETGYKDKTWGLWVSATGENPLPQGTPPGWMTSPVGPALIGAAGGDLVVPGGLVPGSLTLNASFLNVQENKPPLAPNQFNLNLPSRFDYTKAWQVGGRWAGFSKLTYDIKWTFDLANASNLLSFDATYNAAKLGASSGMILGLGTDFFNTATGQGLIGQLQGNDRIRARIAYAF